MTYAKHAGVTLVELMIVIAIAAVLFSVAVPAMNNMSVNGMADRLARELELDIRYARSQASTLGRPITFEPVNGWQDGWVIKDNAVELRVRKHSLAANVITSADITAGTPLVFNAAGRSAADASVTISVPGCTGNRVRTLSVNRIGQVQLSGEAACPQ